MKKVIHVAAFQPGTETADGFIGHFGATSLIAALDEATRRWGPPTADYKAAIGHLVDHGVPPDGMTYRTTWQDIEITEYEVVDG